MIFSWLHLLTKPEFEFGLHFEVKVNVKKGPPAEEAMLEKLINAGERKLLNRRKEKQIKKEKKSKNAKQMQHVKQGKDVKNRKDRQVTKQMSRKTEKQKLHGKENGKLKESWRDSKERNHRDKGRAQDVNLSKGRDRKRKSDGKLEKETGRKTHRDTSSPMRTKADVSKKGKHHSDPGRTRERVHESKHTVR